MKYILIIIEPKGFCASVLLIPENEFCKTEHYQLFKKYATFKTIDNVEIQYFLFNEIEWHLNRGKYVAPFANSVHQCWAE